MDMVTDFLLVNLFLAVRSEHGHTVYYQKLYFISLVS